MKTELSKFFFNYFLAEYKNKIVNLQKKHTQYLEKEIIGNIENQMFDIFEKLSIEYLVFDFKELNKENHLSKYSNIYLNDYKKKLDLQQSKYSPLLNQVRKRLNQFQQHFNNIIENFIKDYYEINDLIENGKIRDISFDIGDSHNDGASVAIITLNNNNKIVYKPKNLEPELSYYNILKKVSYKLNRNIKVPQTYSFDNYGWQEYIEYQPCNFENLAHSYYYNLGIQTCLLYCLNASDMHYENLIVSEDSPILIDLETILQPSFNYNYEDPSENMIAKTVLQTLLFEFSISKNSNLIYMGGTTNQINRPFIHTQLINEDNDQISIVENIINNKNHSSNIPTSQNGTAYEIYNYSSDLVAGFSDCYKLIQMDKNIIMNNLLEKDFKVRSVLRPTYVYTRFIEYFKQLNKSDGVLEILKESNTHFKESNLIAEKELFSITNLDVPYFNVSISSKNLRNNGKVIVNDFFKTSALEELNIKLESLNTKDLDLQLQLIKNSISTYKENIATDTTRNLKVREYSTNLSKELNEIRNSFRNLNTLINIETNNYNNTVFTPISYDLYNGLAGVSIVLLSYFNLEEHEIDNLNNYIYKGFLSDESLNYSIYDGKFSYFKYLLILKKHFAIDLLNEKELQHLLQEYIAYLDANEIINFDYLGGVAGILSLTIDIYENTYNPILKTYIEKLSKVLIKNAVFSKSNEVYWSGTNDFKLGLAHGNTGICLALVKAENIIPELNIRKIINSAINLENLICKKEKLINVWCNGISGLALGRSEIKKINSSYENLNVNLFTDSLIQKPNLPENLQSVCHGTHGNLMILKALNIEVNDINQILSNTFSYEWSSGFYYPNENYSFFLGKTGQLFNMINKKNELIKDILL
ncbi:type 2 lanthipeptide synthetase LanM [Staphylococcus haemolyticus]|uniref:type 2 lanthipeptide synthetase LanM n=1 Tax=Staphylococcus haemolyticus TaxID=1283 RepID=UPI002DC03701|nr:type 2 lanthipeptide synthetase LanM [Staphylococcus haemolyticus]MEB6747780.1 type 2 lanthipeptide synthetase LanM [Staphylococcus haemolyticus]